VTPDYLADALPALRSKIHSGETRLSAFARPRVNVVLGEFMMAIDAAGPRSEENHLAEDVRDVVRQCLGALLVFEVNPDAPELSLLTIFRTQADAIQRMVRAALNAR
jgi:hypothetical protein